jgi:hypothetical protein
VDVLRRLPAPVVTVVAVALLVVGAVFWGTGPHGDGDARPTARVARVRARLTDGVCQFTADVELRDRRSRWTFDRSAGDIRAAFVGLLGRKSRYMVNTAVARESLREQMRDAVNQVARARIAERVTLPEFAVF